MPLAQFGAILRGRSAGALLALLIVLGGGVAAVVGIVLWAREPEFAVLYSNLGSEDAGAIVARLKTQRTPYRISSDGGSLLVPANLVHETRLQLAGQGLPQGGGVGFEIFDKATFGMTDFVQRLNYRRALQGELARTIRHLAEVEQARVHLAVPERSLFADGRDRATASVVLKLKPTARLRKEQVQGIVRLVASSVEGLRPENVTVVDVQGRLLSAGEDPAALGGLTNSQLEYQRNFERNLEQAIQSMLEATVGRHKAVVRVASVLDFNRIEKTEETFDAESPVIRSEQRSTERSTGGAGATAAGIPGMASALPEKAAEKATARAASPAGQSGAGISQKQQETVNYEVSKVIRRVVEPAGGIRKLSAAVLVDGTYQVTRGKAGEEKKYVPRAEEELKKYEAVVKKAMGFNTERGDQVEVVNVPFDVEGLQAEGEAPPPGGGSALVSTGLRYGTALLAVVLFFLFVARPVLQLLSAPVPVSVAGLPRTVQEMEEELQAGGAPQALAGGRQRAIELARSDPSRTAQVIKSWLKEKA